MIQPLGSPVIFDSNCWVKSLSRPSEHKLWLKSYIWVAVHLCKHSKSLSRKIIVLFNIIQRTRTTLRRLQGVLKRSQRLMTKPDVVKTSGKRCLIYDVLKTSYLRHLEDIQFTTSWRRLIYDVFKMSNLGRLEDVWFTISWRHLIYDVLKTSNLRGLENVKFMTSSRRLI